MSTTRSICLGAAVLLVHEESHQTTLALFENDEINDALVAPGQLLNTTIAPGQSYGPILGMVTGGYFRVEEMSKYPVEIPSDGHYLFVGFVIQNQAYRLSAVRVSENDLSSTYTLHKDGTLLVLSKIEDKQARVILTVPLR